MDHLTEAIHTSIHANGMESVISEEHPVSGGGEDSGSRFNVRIPDVL